MKTNKKWLLIGLYSIGLYCILGWVIYFTCPCLPIELPVTLSCVEIGIGLLLGLNYIIGD